MFLEKVLCVKRNIRENFARVLCLVSKSLSILTLHTVCLQRKMLRQRIRRRTGEILEWGYLKDKVYRPYPANELELIARITLELQSIPPDMIKRAINDVYNRCLRVINAQGGYIE